MAYVRDIRQNSIDSHQSSPAYVLTFVRWANRSTFNYRSSPRRDSSAKRVTAAGSLETRGPLVVVNDAISIEVTDAKNSMSSTCSITLKGGEFNYATLVSPGDFVMVNLLNWEDDIIRVRDKARAGKSINQLGDGFKGVFKIQSVVKNLQQNPQAGTKSLTYTVTAASFTEFNNVIYYNPAIAEAFRNRGTNLFQSLIGKFYQDKLKTNSQVQVILKDLFKILLGKSRKDKDVKVPNFGNSHFKIPTLLAQLLGRDDAKYANEIYNYIIGIWAGSENRSFNEDDIGLAFNQSISQDPEDNFFRTPNPILGNKLVFIENWNNATAWSILQQNLNGTLNEMYTTHRISPDNLIQPTVVVRQKPFTTEHFVPPSRYSVTRFFGLPRWRISSNLLLNQQTAKNEAARYNFVQVYTRALASTADQDMAQQIKLGNFVEDERDIQRHGLRPYVVRSNFDFPTKDRNKAIRAPEWAKIVSDWIIDGHLKESGSFTFMGIQDPIAVGDNLEFDNVVYHIESVRHQMVIAPNTGVKSFKTILSVSYGMDLRSSKDGPVYANMNNLGSDQDTREDWENERLLPGISDTQNIPPSRVLGEQVIPTKKTAYTPQELLKPRVKTQEENTGRDANHQLDDKGRSKKK